MYKINSKDLLYRTEDYIQYLVLTYNGKESEKEYAYEEHNKIYHYPPTKNLPEPCLVHTWGVTIYEMLPFLLYLSCSLSLIAPCSHKAALLIVPLLVSFFFPQFCKVEKSDTRTWELGKVKSLPSLFPSETIHSSWSQEEVLLDLPASTALNLWAKLTGSLFTFPQDSKVRVSLLLKSSETFLSSLAQDHLKSTQSHPDFHKIE